MNPRFHFHLFSLLIGLMIPLLLPLKAQGDETVSLETLRRTYAELLCTTEGMEAQQDIISRLPIEEQNGDICVMETYLRLYPVRAEVMEQLIEGLDATGSWPDIDYKSQQMSGWPPAIHQMRLLDMVKYYRRMQGDEPSIRKKELKDAIHRAIAAWIDKKLQSPNWWQNVIGTPKLIGEAFILFRDEMGAEELAACQELMKKSPRARFTLTGQNKLWFCEVQLLSALLCDDASGVEAARAEILKLIVVGEKEGIQKDWSFHQHGAQQQMGNYGISYLMSMSFISRLFAGTALVFPEDKQNILNQFYLQGYQWMRWGQVLDMNAMGRQISRNVMKQKGVASYVSGLMLFGDHKPLQHSPLGQKHFEESELSIHRSVKWMASLRMASSRLIGVESCNKDGRTASFMGDGALYIYQSPDGYEYENILPLWNPRLIPGITCQLSTASAQDLVARNQTDFVGGVTDGTSGISSMELNRYGVRAFKSWVITDECILCLGSDLQGQEESTPRTLSTCIANRISRNQLYHYDKGQWIESPDRATHKASLRLYHDRIGYIILNANKIQIEHSEKRGDWHEVSDFYPLGTMHQDKVLSIYLEHPKEEHCYQYLILPATRPEAVAQFDTSQLRILYQNADIHAVQIGDCYYIALRHSGDYPLPFDGEVSITKPGIYLVKKKAGVWSLQRASYPE